MSIINDALKKAEANLQKNSAQNRTIPKPGKPNVFLLYILILAVGLFLANFIFGQLKNKATPKTNPPQKTAATSQPQLKTQITAIPLASRTPVANKQTDNSAEPVLNGIFISDDGLSYALINNRIVKVDDEVNGAKITQIKENSVELEKDGKISTLYNR